MTDRAASDNARKTGRGVIFITGAKLYFIIAGFAIQFWLPHKLGTAQAFGLYSTAMNFVSIFNNVLIAATVQAVSKHVSEDPSRAPATLRQGLKLQGVLGAMLFAAFFLTAPLVANQVLLDPELEPLIRITAIVLLSYSLYATLVGALNGQRLFHKQAGLDITFSTMRLAFILGGAAWIGGALGAVAGFATAALSILLIAFVLVGTGGSGETLPLKRWFAFLAPIWLYQWCMNGTLQIDLMVIKRTVAELSVAAGASASVAAATASECVGYYRAAQTFAFVPYQVILSVTFVVFPLVAHASALGDTERTKAYIRNAMRFSLLILAAMAAPIAGAAKSVMHLAYPPAFVAGAPALSVLTVGIVAFAMFVIAATILSGTNRPLQAAIIALIGLITVVVANRVAIVVGGVGPNTLAYAAAGTSFGMLVALVCTAYIVYRAFGAFLPIATVVRVAVASAAAAAAAHFAPVHGRIGALFALTAGGLAYIALLFVLREITSDDIATVKNVLGRGKKPAA